MPNKAPATYPKGYIKSLYTSGLAAQLTFDKKIQHENTIKNEKFRKHIVASIKENNNKSEFDSNQALLDLFKILCFISAWSDSKGWSDVAIRQRMKFKKNISKSKRKSIHAALFKSVYEILLQFKHEGKIEEKEKYKIEEFLKKLEGYDLNKTTLFEITKDFLKYKKYKSNDKENKESSSETNFLAATQKISEFSFWYDKFLYGCGFSIGLIAALACGLSTGAAIFVLLASFSLPLGFVIPLSLLIFFAGTRANFQLFSQHIPQFFNEICKTDGMTGFIDQQGKRLQLSKTKKFLFLPAGFLSLSVGIAAAAITYLEGTKMLALIWPMLTATCPHLVATLLGILAAALLIGLTIIMLRTFIKVLQSEFSWQGLKGDIQEKWQNLNFTKGLCYAFKTLVMLAAFFGLVYLDFTSTATLAGLLGWIAADAITLAAIIGDLPFTLMTALAWCNSLFKNNSNPDSNTSTSKPISYYVCKIVEFFALIINAFGNAALVFTDSSVSRIASIAAFMNSYASNRIQEDDSPLIQARIDATEKSLSSLSTFFKSASETSPVEPLMANGLLNRV